MDITQRYCSTCGVLMRSKRSKPKGYDEYTGKPWYEMYFTCPNWSIWRFWHSSVTVSDNQRYKYQQEYYMDEE